MSTETEPFERAFNVSWPDARLAFCELVARFERLEEERENWRISSVCVQKQRTIDELAATLRGAVSFLAYQQECATFEDPEAERIVEAGRAALAGLEGKSATLPLPGDQNAR